MAEETKVERPEQRLFVAREIDRVLPEHSAQSYQNLPPEVRAIISQDAYHTWAKAKVAPEARLQWQVVMDALLPRIRSSVYSTLEQKRKLLDFVLSNCRRK